MDKCRITLYDPFSTVKLIQGKEIEMDEIVLGIADYLYRGCPGGAVDRVMRLLGVDDHCFHEVMEKIIHEGTIDPDALYEVTYEMDIANGSHGIMDQVGGVSKNVPGSVLRRMYEDIHIKIQWTKKQDGDDL